MYTKANLAALRVKKDIAELSRQRLNATHASTSIDFPDGTRNLLKLKVGVSMTAGLYEGATFYFLVTIPPSYPFHAPSAVCTSRAWHPNIDLHSGFVSLPILTTDWRPVLSINTVVFALQLMFLEPSELMPVNESAAAALANPELFREQVRRTLAGGFLFGVQFEPHRQGSGCGNSDGPGAAQKRKRGEGMDTEEVQTTLEAMRIQEDGHVEESSAWEKRPRYQRQSKSPFAFEQPPRNQPSPVPTQMEGVGGSALLTLSNAAGGQPYLSFLEQQQQAQAQTQAQSSAMAEGEALFASPSLVGGASFDRMRFHELNEADMSAAAPIGFRCSGAQEGVAQPMNSVVKEGSTVWGSGQFQAIPAPSLR